MIDIYITAKALFEISLTKNEFMQYATPEEAEMWDELLGEYMADLKEETAGHRFENWG